MHFFLLVSDNMHYELNLHYIDCFNEIHFSACFDSPLLFKVTDSGFLLEKKHRVIKAAGQLAPNVSKPSGGEATAKSSHIASNKSKHLYKQPEQGHKQHKPTTSESSKKQQDGTTHQFCCLICPFYKSSVSLRRFLDFSTSMGESRGKKLEIFEIVFVTLIVLELNVTILVSKPIERRSSKDRKRKHSNDSKDERAVKKVERSPSSGSKPKPDTSEIRQNIKKSLFVSSPRFGKSLIMQLLLCLAKKFFLEPLHCILQYAANFIDSTSKIQPLPIRNANEIASVY